MGKAKEERLQSRRRVRLGQGQSFCEDLTAPICECCSLYDNENGSKLGKQPDGHSDEVLKELVVIGSGPHAMALILRLLQPDADLMSEKERNLKADHHSKKLRPIHEVRRYARELSKGPSAILKKRKQKVVYSKDVPPPIDLVRLRKSVLIVDKSTPKSNRESGWLSHWNNNFEAIEIPYLRSPTTAHLDPFDVRSLDYYADVNSRNDDLISLKYLKQHDREFHGPYQAPSTSLFRDFHHVLGKAYGINDMVHSSMEVDSIIAKSGSERLDQEPYFEIHVKSTTNKIDDSEKDTKLETFVTVKAKRVVCALGPMFRTGTEFWEESLPNICKNRILHCHEIVPWILHRKDEVKPSEGKEDPSISVLIVGGGITSTHLSLLAGRAPWCKSVTLIHRSRIKERQFDIDNKWMGPLRGRLLDEFWSLDSLSKVEFLKEARRGGSIPPELVEKMLRATNTSNGRMQVKQEVQISDVTWNGEQFCVQLDDGTSESYFDMIWLATGADNDIALYQPLHQLTEDLPIDVAGGLPVLDSDLSWKRPSRDDDDDDDDDDDAVEAPWKSILRRRIHVMGCLAGLQLGPDALNLVGARHGAVRVAKALRLSMWEN